MSSDAEVARVGRELAHALADYGYSRKDEDKKRVSALQAELCRVCGERPQDAPVT